MASTAIFVAFTIIGLVAMVTSVEVFNGQCPQPNGDFANPISQRCKTYVRCQGGVPSNMVCPPGQRFDFVLRQCLARRLIDCPGQKASILSLPNALNPALSPEATLEPTARAGGNNAFAGLGQPGLQVGAAQGQVQPLPLVGPAAASVRRVGRRGRQVAPGEVPAPQGQPQGARVQGQGANRGQGQVANRGQGQGARVNAGQGRPSVNRGVVTDVPELFATLFPTFVPVTATVDLPGAQRPRDLPASVPITPLGGPIAAQDRPRGPGQDAVSNATAGIALQGRSTFP